MQKGKVTLKDISKKVHVSTAAVSLALNDDRRITLSEKTRLLIKKTAKEMGYDYSRLESRRKESRNVLFVIDNWNKNHISTSFFSNVAVHLKSLLHPEGFHLIESEFNDTESGQMKLLLESYPRIIVTSSLRFIRELRRSNSRVPVIFLQGDRRIIPKERLIAVLMVDDRRVGELAARELAERNAHNCALVFPSDSIRCVQQRIEGFSSFWLKMNKRMECLRIPELDKIDFMILNSIIRKTLGKFDSYYFFSDALALYGLKIFHDNGHSVPEDILVIGTDNLYWSEYSIPSLTTMDLKESQFAQYILKEVLLDRKTARQQESAISFSIQPDLIVRESTQR